MANTIIYEHPLNERIRTLLRLEHLFAQLRYFLNAKTAWDSRAFIASLMELLDLFARSDLRQEMLKEVERANNNLSPLLDISAINHERLRTVLRALNHLTSSLHALQGQPGNELRNNDLLTAIRQRSVIPGGACDFDLPAFHQWLSGASERRLTDQQQWFDNLDTVRQTVELLIKLIRNSADPQERIAENGSYQQALDTAQPFQLIRVTLPIDAPYYPEISGSKHRITLRFLQPGEGRASQYEADISFQLSCCSL